MNLVYHSRRFHALFIPQPVVTEISSRPEEIALQI